MPSIGPRIGIKGETEYRQALMRMISETKSLNAEMNLMTAKFKDNQSAMSKNKELAEQYSKILASAEKNVTNFKDALEKATQKHEAAKAKQAELNKQLEEAKRQYGENSNEVKNLEKELNKTNLEVERSGKNVNEWKTKLYEAETEVVEYKKKLEDASNTVKHFGEDMQRIGGEISDVGQKISSFGDTLTTYVTTPLVALGTASIKASSDFTDGMAKIYTIATESQKPMAEMREELEQLSASSAFGLEDLTEATYQAVSASVDTAHAVGFVNDATRLARAGFTDTTMAVDLLTTAINAYGYKAEDAAYISDVLLKTQNDGKTVINELAGSMGTVIPTAAAYNVSLENLAAAYVMMTKQGINTARSTTFLNSMFTELERASSDVSKILAEKTGKSFAQLMDEGKSLGDVLGILYDAVGKDDEAFARLWKNVRAGRGGLALVNTGVDAFNTALQRVSNSAGQTQYALDVLETPSLKAKRALNQLKIETVELGDTMIEKLYPLFEKGVSIISDITDKVMAMDDETMNSIVSIGMMVAAVGPAISIGGKVIDIFGKIQMKLGQLMATGLTTTQTVFLAVAAYAALGAAAKKMQDERFAEIEAEYGLNERMKVSIQTVNDLKTAHDEYVASINQEKDAVIKDADYATYLTQKYNELVGENGKLKDGSKALADTLINELAKTLGISVEETRKLIEKNGQFGESIEKNIAQIKQRAEMAAYEDLYTEAIKRKIAAEDENVRQQEELRQAHIRTEEAQRQYDQALQEYNAHLADGTAKTGGYEDKLQDAQSALVIAKDAENQLTTAVNDSYEVVQQATSDIETYSQKMLEAGGASAEMSQAISENTGKALDATETLKKGAEANLSFDGYNIGKAAIVGYANGMNDQKRYVISTASTIANAANKAMRNTLEIKSPSRVMKEVGGYTVEGFALGMEDSIGMVRQAADMLANSAVQTANSMNYYSPNGYGTTYNSTRQISAPISVNVNVNGSVDDVDALAETIAEKIADNVIRREEVFA